jgi:hypothetical protein
MPWGDARLGGVPGTYGGGYAGYVGRSVPHSSGNTSSSSFISYKEDNSFLGCVGLTISTGVINIFTIYSITKLIPDVSLRYPQLSAYFYVIFAVINLLFIGKTCWKWYKFLRGTK